MSQAQSYDIYGIGNALLDMDYHVDDADLQRLAIDKGLMTLIDAEEQRRVEQALPNQPQLMASGGSVANSIVTASYLGARCYLSCRVANDDAGQHYIRSLRRAKVQSPWDQQPPPVGHSGKCMAFITADGERSMLSYLGESANFCVQDIDAAALQAAKVLYIEGYLVASDVSMQAVLHALKLAKAAGVSIALSLSDVNMVLYFKDRLQQILDCGVDVLFANQQEAAAFCETQNIAQQQHILLNLAQQVLITRGAKGSLLSVKQANQMLEQHDIPAYTVKAIDTLGAGDAFAGTYLAAYVRGLPAADCAQQASFMASRIVAKSGPRFTGAEIQQLQQQLVDLLEHAAV